MILYLLYYNSFSLFYFISSSILNRFLSRLIIALCRYVIIFFFGCIFYSKLQGYYFRAYFLFFNRFKRICSKVNWILCFVEVHYSFSVCNNHNLVHNSRTCNFAIQLLIQNTICLIIISNSYSNHFCKHKLILPISIILFKLRVYKMTSAISIMGK